MLRSKAKIVEDDENPTKFFLKHENNNYKNKHITKLIVNDKIITNPKTILIEESHFYEELYTKKNEHENSLIDVESLFDDIPRLDEIDIHICDAPITMIDIAASLKELPNNKTPGSDG